jgi:hypothetical protein
MMESVIYILLAIAAIDELCRARKALERIADRLGDIREDAVQRDLGQG